MILLLLPLFELAGLIWSMCVLARINHGDRCFVLIGSIALIFGWLFFSDLGTLVGSDFNYIQQAPYRYVARSLLFIGIGYEWAHIHKKRNAG